MPHGVQVNGAECHLRVGDSRLLSCSSMAVSADIAAGCCSYSQPPSGLVSIALLQHKGELLPTHLYPALAQENWFCLCFYCW